MTDRVLILAGPTAVGKSALTAGVARSVGAEIVVADSRQVYRGLDVGTAKPTPDGLVRHGLNLLDPGHRWSAGSFRTWCDAVVADAHSRGCPVVIEGGSTLYLEALVRGLADLPAVPVALEASLMAQIRDDPEPLFRELAEADPVAASTLDPTKSQRLARLVGLWRLTGRRPSSLWAERHVPPLMHRLVVLTRPRDELYRRIEARVDAMVAAGLADEARGLVELGPEVRQTLAATIGYREWLPVFEGQRTAEEAVSLVKRNTRRYAKRQLTWLRRYSDALWLDAGSADAAEVLRAAEPWPAPERTGGSPAPQDADQDQS